MLWARKIEALPWTTALATPGRGQEDPEGAFMHLFLFPADTKNNSTIFLLVWPWKHRPEAAVGDVQRTWGLLLENLQTTSCVTLGESLHLSGAPWHGEVRGPWGTTKEKARELSSFRPSIIPGIWTSSSSDSSYFSDRSYDWATWGDEGHSGRFYGHIPPNASRTVGQGFVKSAPLLVFYCCSILLPASCFHR